MSIAIISDTDTSLPPEDLEKFDITQVPITIHFGEDILKACSDITDQGLVDMVSRLRRQLPHQGYFLKRSSRRSIVERTRSFA